MAVRKRKLNALGYGIEDDAIAWFRSYEQTARQQVCHVNRVTSSMATMTVEFLNAPFWVRYSFLNMLTNFQSL